MMTEFELEADERSAPLGNFGGWRAELDDGRLRDAGNSREIGISHKAFDAYALSFQAVQTR
jgi:hypothetical protein